MLRHLLASEKNDAPARVNRKVPLAAGAAHSLVWLLAEGMAVLLVLLAATVVVLDRAEVRLPFAAKILADRMSETLAGQHFEIDSLSFSVARADRFAGVTAYGVALVGDDDVPLLAVPEVAVKFTLLDLLKGEVRPERVQITGAEVFIRKTVAGTFKLALGADSTAIDALPGASASDLNDYVSGTEFLREVPELAKLAEVALTGAKVTYRDDVLGRSWQIERGKLVLRALSSGYQASVSGKLAQADGQGPQVSIVAKQDVISGNSRLIADFSNTRPADLADQFPPLEPLRVLDAPASGKLTLDVDAKGNMLAFGGRLAVGAGRIVRGGVPDMQFQSANSEFAFDPATSTFALSRLALVSELLSLQSQGHVMVETAAGKLVAQLVLQDIAVLPSAGFSEPLAFPEGRAAVKVQLQPFMVTVGEFIAFDGAKSVTLRGDLRPGSEGLAYALDFDAANLDLEDLKAFWPRTAAPKARIWLAENILAGTIPRVAGGLRADGAEAKYTVNFDFSAVTARFLKFMPNAVAASGFGTLNEKSFELNIVKADVKVPGKGVVAAGGTRIVFPEYRLKPAPAVVNLVAEGDFAPLFDLLNRPPLSLLDKGRIDPGIASGHAVVSASLRFPAKRALKVAEVQAAADADFSGVSSERLADGRLVSADAMTFSARDGVMRISGAAEVDSVPVSFEWQRGYGPGTTGNSSLRGTVVISRQTLADFGMNLPDGSIGGQSTGEMDIALPRGKAPEFRLDADLGPLALNIPALGWSKPAGEAGSALLTGTLGETLELGPVSIAASGLTASGRLDLDGGNFHAATFDNLAVNGWLDAALDYAPGRAKISGGSIDLRRRGGGSGSGTDVTLDGTGIVVTETVTLAGATGSLRSGAMLEGNLQARVNGGAAVQVALLPNDDGQRITVTGNDAGQILRDAGLFRNALGGDLRLTMVQTGGPGEYRGAFEIHNIRVRDAPVLAALLSAASIIGFLEQLDGNGLAFITVSGRFTMKDGVIELLESKAVGPSIGISLEGRYRPSDKLFDMNGVISPLYAINGIFEKLPIIGRLLGGKDGEGLIGFSYLLRGSADAPRISVNPLSILTPGALREIFEPRRAPAEPPVPEPEAGQ